MYCLKCGTQYKDTFAFCPKCGAANPRKAGGPATTGRPAAPVPPAQPAAPPAPAQSVPPASARPVSPMQPGAPAQPAASAQPMPSAQPVPPLPPSSQGQTPSGADKAKRLVLALPFVVAGLLAIVAFVSGLDGVVERLKNLDGGLPALGTLAYVLVFVMAVLPALGAVPLVRGALRGSLGTGEVRTARRLGFFGIVCCVAVGVLMRLAANAFAGASDQVVPLLELLGATYPLWLFVEAGVLLVGLILLVVFGRVGARPGELPSRSECRMAKRAGTFNANAPGVRSTLKVPTFACAALGVAGSALLVFMLVSGPSGAGALGGSKGPEQKKETEQISFEEAQYDDLYCADPATEIPALDEATGVAYMSNEILLIADEDAEKSEVEQVIADAGGTLVGFIDAADTYQVQFPETRTLEELEKLADELDNDRAIDAAYPNYGMPMDNTEDDKPTNDPVWDDSEQSWWLRAARVPEAWEAIDSSRTSITVGVIDTDLYDEHEDLNVAVSYYNMHGSGEGMKERDNGGDYDEGRIKGMSHATHVIGIIDAMADNKKGVVGVGHGNRIAHASFRGLDDKYDAGYIKKQTSYDYRYFYDDMYCIAMLASKEGARVINMSYGLDWTTFGSNSGVAEKQWHYPTQDDINMADSIAHAYADSLSRIVIKYDLLLCKSAGNDNDDYDSQNLQYIDRKSESGKKYQGPYQFFPADSNYVVKAKSYSYDLSERMIVVGAAEQLGDESFVISDYSNGGSAVDIAAPGTSIYSTIPEKNGRSNSLAKSSYGMKSGTSMATPMVTGCAAYILSVRPDLSAKQVKEIIIQASQDRMVDYADLSKFTGTPYGVGPLPFLDVNQAIEHATQRNNDTNGWVIPGEHVVSSEQIIPVDETPTISNNFTYLKLRGDRDVMLCLDVSGSMEGDPIDQTKDAVSDFLQVLEQYKGLYENGVMLSDPLLEKPSDTPETTIVDESSKGRVECGVVSYGDDADLVAPLTPNISDLSSKVEALSAGGSTNMGAGLELANDQFNLYPKHIEDGRIIVLMSDGVPEAGMNEDEIREYANKLKDSGVKIYTVGFYSKNKDADAQALMNDIASEGCHYEVSGSNSLNDFFYDIGDQINGKQYIYVRIACPVDVEVSYGDEVLSSVVEGVDDRTSFGSLSYEDIEGSDDKVKVLRLAEGLPYDLKINGYATGEMKLSIGLTDENGDYTDTRTFTVPVTKDMQANARIERADFTTLHVDEDGDGVYEKAYRADANSEGTEVDSAWQVWLVLAGFAVMFLLCFVAAVVRAVGKRKAVVSAMPQF